MSALQNEVSALEELSRQLFIEYVDLSELRVFNHTCIDLD
jgi:hypothetical protein